MRLSGWLGTFVTLVILCTAMAALPPQEARGPLRTLVTAREVHDLSHAEASLAYPVHLRAVVTYFDSDLNDFPVLYVNDSTGGVFVEFPNKTDLKPDPGDLVDVVGVSGPGDFASVVAHPQVRVIGRSHLPEQALKVNLRGITAGKFDAQWVEIAGMVHEVHFTQKNVTLDLSTTAGPGGLLRATSPREPGVDYQALVDALIVIRGNAGAVFNWDMRMIGGQLLFPSIRQIAVKKVVRGDPFNLPPVPFAELMRFSPSMDIPHRVHVQGSVVLQWPGRQLCLRQADATLCMDTGQTKPVPEGSLVDAIGFPGITKYKHTLENVSYRLAHGAGAPVSVRPISADEALHSNFDGQLLELEGRLVDLEHVGEDIELKLQLKSQSKTVVVPAIVPESLAAKDAAAWKIGSVLRLMGLCNRQAKGVTWKLHNGQVRPGSLQLLLRSAADVKVVRSPSWWTLQHALGILVAVVLIAVAAIAWIIILRHRVQQQTQALRESQERLRHLSEHDALTGLPNRILLGDRMNVALKRAERFHERLGLLMVDIDRFKEANDTYGHHAGDVLLCEIANRLSDSVRKTDTVARIGGDEFIVLLPDLQDPQDAELVAAKILAAISAPVDIGMTSISITASIGVSTYPDGGMDFEELVHTADAAMYFAKSRGRNALHVSHSAEV
jgi:diguanylate cyclase (GGDEF)-like protein